MARADAQQTVHRDPTEKTVKQLYGTAFQCGEPECPKPLYRMNNDTGEWLLNSRVAHIHARSPDGPRWDPLMSEEDNRSAPNLVLLCIEHAYEIDDTPQHFPADLLQAWKQRQLADYEAMHRSWLLTDAQAAEAATASFDPHQRGVTSAAATTVISAIRYAGLMIETGRRYRHHPAEAAATWNVLRRRVNASMPSFGVNGERLRVEPSHVEQAPHRAALDSALAEAEAAVADRAALAVAELRAVCAAAPELARWCDWVERSTRQLVSAAGRWPGRPPIDDDQVWPEAIAELQRAAQALGEAWRGGNAAEPPEPQPVPEETETDQQRAYREHRELLETASPWGRVSHLPYDADLCERLMTATELVAPLPFVLSLAGAGLQATARLAARVARNADDSTYRALIHRATDQRPLAAAAHLLNDLARTAGDEGRNVLQREAETTATTLLTTESWRDQQVWCDNEVHARTLLAWTASLSDDTKVRATLAAVIEHSPELLPEILAAMAGWSESLDPTTDQRLSRRISSLPAWFPSSLAARVIQDRMPGLAPANEDDSERHRDETQRLASQLLWLSADNSG